MHDLSSQAKKIFLESSSRFDNEFQKNLLFKPLDNCEISDKSRNFQVKDQSKPNSLIIKQIVTKM